MKANSKPWPRYALLALLAALVCVAVCRSASAQASASASVSTQAPAPAGLAIRPDRVILLDLARSGDALLAVGERGVVLRSRDNGGSWQAVGTPATRTLSGIAMADGLHGVAVGHGGTVLRTFDGGAHWTPVKVDAAGSDALLGVLHLGGGDYLAYGAFGLYLESRDGGASWSRSQPLGADFDRHISHIVASNDGLLLVGESGTLARSTYAGSFFGAVAGGDGVLLAYGMRGNVYRSLDAGKSWQKIELGTSLALMNGRRLDDGRIVLAGNAGLLAVSTDNGASFTLHKSARGKGIAQLDTRASDGASLLTVGEGGVERVRIDNKRKD
jgi:photosystem II stability/assembly factor-like uncharacterized protein